MNIVAFLKERLHRQEYNKRILKAVFEHYETVDPDTVVCRQCVSAGHLYAFLSIVLNESNNTPFQQKVRHLLISLGIAKIGKNGNATWFKGILGKEEDLQQASKSLQQHYKDRKNYVERQRLNGKKRWKHDR